MPSSQLYDFRIEGPGGETLWQWGNCMLLRDEATLVEIPGGTEKVVKSMFGGQSLSCKGHFFDDTSLLFLTVPTGTLFKKTPRLIKKLTLFAFKPGLQTCSKAPWHYFFEGSITREGVYVAAARFVASGQEVRMPFWVRFAYE